jgi:DNA-binding transcriptional MerR regulator
MTEIPMIKVTATFKEFTEAKKAFFSANPHLNNSRGKRPFVESAEFLKIRESLSELTITEVAKKFGVSRQAVYSQAKRKGLVFKKVNDGKTERKSLESRERTLLKQIAKYGYTLRHIEEISGHPASSPKSPITRYRNMANYAKKQKVCFTLSFKQWFDLVGVAGSDKRSSEMRCLIRLDKSRGYEPENIFIGQLSDVNKGYARSRNGERRVQA